MAKKIIVHGKVQGVFFRDYTRKKATELNLKGYVGNMPDGTVKVIVEDDERIDELIQWLKLKGSPSSRVDKVDIEDIKSEETFTGFEIRH